MKLQKTLAHLFIYVMCFLMIIVMASLAEDFGKLSSFTKIGVGLYMITWGVVMPILLDSALERRFEKELAAKLRAAKKSGARNYALELKSTAIFTQIINKIDIPVLNAKGETIANRSVAAFTTEILDNALDQIDNEAD